MARFLSLIQETVGSIPQGTIAYLDMHVKIRTGDKKI